MKALKLVCLTVLVVSIYICFNLATAAAQDVSYLGEFCFNLQGGNGGKNLQLGALSFGAGHFPVHGKIADVGSAQPMAVHGTALPDGNNFSVTLSAAGISTPNKQTFSITYYLSVDAGSLSGTYTSIEFYLVGTGAPQPQNEYSVYIDRGTITSIACP